ncbi:hypothetical protein P154DRAFT_537365 [Amniculicola lignicola CBS 123094]|uniref:Uncharacterized protein n=1 Tax=Amniculicola lignicola CBS 123094 TaxID=1392246 RepID=A0A6A5W5T8_9PLEO|nr:hypothetical protein P154DRAFT_537365 [Amniculicola lignicola CBS 123094]
MTAGLMRRLFSSSARARLPLQHASNSLAAPRLLGLKTYQRSITDVRTRQASISRTWFTSTTATAYPDPGGDHKPPSERDLKLGKTIRILHDKLPTMLSSPLPQDILSPQITLRLFPSTHHHLPAVSGKLAYTAALTTAPVAWGRVPVLGNVKLTILSERMTKNGGSTVAANMRHEKLIVRWKTCGKEKQNGPASEVLEKIWKIIGISDGGDFSGLFVFEFDEDGRIINHTIEHVEEGGNWDKPAKVISVTDWLLGRAWGRKSDEGGPSLAFARTESEEGSQRSDKAV